MGISATGRATLGNATDAIESIAESEHADVVVLATPTFANGHDLGETAERLLGTATRPVLLVGRDAHISGKYAAALAIRSSHNVHATSPAHLIDRMLTLVR